jgi:hypothetical protein
MTIEHGEGPSWSRTWVYRASGNPTAMADFSRSLTAAGWAANPALDSTGVRHYTNGRRECFLGGAGLGRDAVVILVYRMMSGSGTQP